MSEKLVFLAGGKAYRKIKDNGLSPEMVKVIAGAAGGPKWIVLSALDRLIFSEWLLERPEPVHLLGSSIGSYRFAAAMGKNPAASIGRLLDAYIHQAYKGKPSAKEVTEKGEEILRNYLDEEAVENILAHPFLRLNILAVRCMNMTASEKKSVMIPGLLAAMLANAISRKNLKFFFKRTLFYDKRSEPPFFNMNTFPTDRVPLSRENLVLSILASGSIPVVMEGVTGIPGTKGGMFRDGGAIDYHLDVPFGVEDGIVLFPHYTDRIIPGWLDKQLTYRKPRKEHFENVLIVAPAKDFTASLPNGKIPDRNDFKTFFEKDRERFAFWKTVAQKSGELADEFHDAVSSGKIKDRVRLMV